MAKKSSKGGRGLRLGKHPITVDVPDALHDAVLALAVEEDRTLSGQVIRLLREAMRARGLDIPAQPLVTSRGLAQVHDEGPEFPNEEEAPKTHTLGSEADTVVRAVEALAETHQVHLIDVNVVEPR
jgi:hypothetical protein